MATGSLPPTSAKPASARGLPGGTRGDRHPAPSLIGMSLIHGYTTGFWVGAVIFAVGAVICGTLFRSGPLRAAESATAATPALTAGRTPDLARHR
jgi:hypothetical protein